MRKKSSGHMRTVSFITLANAPSDMCPNASAQSEQNIAIHMMKLITKTRLYNFDPFKPHFYIVKLGFTGVYIIFLISAQSIDCGYSLEPPRRGGSNEYPQSMF